MMVEQKEEKDLALYGEWQTEEYQPPIAVEGKVGGVAAPWGVGWRMELRLDSGSFAPDCKCACHSRKHRTEIKIQK